MTWIDAAIVIIFLYFIITAFNAGFIRETIGMAAALLGAVLAGEHSFEAFAKAGQPERGTRCRVSTAEWHGWELGSRFTVTADRYLHHMVRYLVGTMVDIGLGRRPAGDLAERALIAIEAVPNGIAEARRCREARWPGRRIDHHTRYTPEGPGPPPKQGSRRRRLPASRGVVAAAAPRNAGARYVRGIVV